MFLWTASVISLLLLLTGEPQGQHANGDTKSVTIEETSEEKPTREILTKKMDWYLRQAYSDVSKILSHQNSCSDFYRGPRAATIVLNDLVAHVKPGSLVREISFQMGGNLTFIHNPSAGVVYRLFDRAVVNTNGSFYQRRTDPVRNVPADVGNFLPGSRRARALILLHELAHLIEGEDGGWLIPDDGFNVKQSRANTLRIQKVCRAQLEALK
ncbi:MAG TPA: hypothetical protein VJM50_06495 [Pyrinomonadaceae bacterium]|nr:hypothetical protein [Pyrinomonadaceae bacterium]